MPQTRRVRTAFTLVEMLVVVGIIAILVAITLGVASAVVEGGRKRTTEGLIRALDQTLDIYIDQRGQIPPALIAVPPNRLVGGGILEGQAMYYPLIDGVVQIGNGAPFQTFDSVGVYMFAAEEIPEVQSILSGLDQRFVQRVRTSGTVAGSGDAQSSQADIEFTTIRDAWGNPIRMVHPRFDGVIKGDGQFGSIGILPTTDSSDGFFTASELPAQARRYLPFRRIRRLAPDRETWRGLTPQQIAQNFSNGVGDSDGGICPTPRPYFYSAGPDGDPSTIDDNVYITRPRFAEPN